MPTLNQRPAILSLLCCALLVTLLPLLTADTAEAKKKKKEEIGVVAGLVVDQGSKTLRDVQVTVTDKDTGEKVGEAVTDKKGEFEITLDMPTGQYAIHLEGEGYAPYDNVFDLEAGNRVDIEFTLLDAAVGLKNQAIEVFNEGVTLHAQGFFGDAKKKFLEAIEISPDVAEPWLGLADVSLMMEKPEEGVEAVERYMAMKPDSQQGKRLAYEIYRRVGRIDEAKALGKELGLADDLDKDLAIEAYNAGAVASQARNYDKALEKFEEALQIDPTLGPAWAGVASIRYNRQEFEQAKEPAQKAVELQPDHVQSRRILFLVLNALNDSGAGAAWDSYSEVDQQGALHLLFQQAELDFKNDQQDVATKALQKILTVDADHARAHFLLGKIYASTDTAKAKAHLEKFIALAPDDPEVETAKSMIAYF